MKPKQIEIVHTAHDAMPTVAAIEPIENSTSAGTPLAIQKAPVQLMPRCRPPWSAGVAETTPSISSAFAIVATVKSPLDGRQARTLVLSGS